MLIEIFVHIIMLKKTRVWAWGLPLIIRFLYFFELQLLNKTLHTRDVHLGTPILNQYSLNEYPEDQKSRVFTLINFFLKPKILVIKSKCYQQDHPKRRRVRSNNKN